MDEHLGLLLGFSQDSVGVKQGLNGGLGNLGLDLPKFSGNIWSGVGTGILKASDESPEFGELMVCHFRSKVLAAKPTDVDVGYLGNVLLLGGSNGKVGKLLELYAREGKGLGFAATERQDLFEFVDFGFEEFIPST